MQTSKLLFGSTIGIIGGGQLGRMMATAAKHMGYRIIVLDPTPDCPTAQVADHQIVASYDDLEAIQHLAEKSDVVTYEFENVDLTAARILEDQGILPQGADSLKITQDRELEKQAMIDSNQPVAAFKIVQSENELNIAARTIGYPLVVKTCRGGYDGKGQVKVASAENLESAQQMFQQADRLIVEKWIPFDKEISIVFTRSQTGEITYFPIAENIHREHILHATMAPGNVSEQVAMKARQAAKAIAETINVVGTFAIEMFVCGEDVLINELAPRPHNSGHYTIEACNVSQFEQHIRAICGLPLISIHSQGAVMVNLLGKDVQRFFDQLEANPDAHIHMYGKAENKPLRKMGHLTFVGEDASDIYQKLTRKKLIENK